MKKLLLILLLFSAGTSFGQVVANNPSPINLCDDTNPGDGIEVFDLTIREDEIINGQTNVTVSYHLTSGDALGNGGSIMNPESYTNTSNPQQLFIRLQGNGDFDITTLLIEVVSYAMADALPEDIFIDEGDANGQAVFDLTENEDIMLGDQFAVDFVFTYFLSQADCENQTNQLANPSMFENTENPQSIYVRMEPFNAPCGTCYPFEISSDGILGISTNPIKSLKIYPNPATNFIKVELEDLAFAEILIRDIQGRLIKSVQCEENTQLVDVSVLKRGVYFLSLEINNKTLIKRFIKK